MLQLTISSVRRRLVDDQISIAMHARVLPPHPVPYSRPASSDQDDHAATATVEASSDGHKGIKHPSGDVSKCPPTAAAGPPGAAAFLLPSSWQAHVGLAVGAAFFVVIGIVLGRWLATRSGYVILSDPV